MPQPDAFSTLREPYREFRRKEQEDYFPPCSPN